MSSILIRRANMVSGGNSPRLPAGYTELAYLESTGTQRLDIGFSGNANFELTAQSSVVPSSNNLLLCSTNNGTAGTWIGSASNGKWGVGNSSSNYINISVTTKAEIVVNFVNGEVSGTVNGVSFSRTATATTNGQWSLFQTNGGRYPFSGKVWGLKGYQNNVLVAELVPAMRDSDSVVGMYDLVSNTFLTNAGSGTFSYGTL